MLRSFVPVVAAVLFAFSACSDDETTSPPPGSGVDSGTGGTDAATGGDSGGTTSKAVNGCTSYTDGTTITWDISIKPPASCLRVKKGGSVTFNGAFSSHPLAAKGGDGAGTPFTTVTDSGTTASFTFPTVGTFGFVCNNHPTMTGAVEVIP